MISDRVNEYLLTLENVLRHCNGAFLAVAITLQKFRNKSGIPTVSVEVLVKWADTELGSSWDNLGVRLNVFWAFKSKGTRAVA